jgi:hypothetical protein
VVANRREDRRVPQPIAIVRKEERLELRVGAGAVCDVSGVNGEVIWPCAVEPLPLSPNATNRIVPVPSAGAVRN